MRSLKYFLFVIVMVLVFGGCSAKEFKEGAKGIGNDVGRLFEVHE